MAFTVAQLITEFRVQIADTELPYLWTDAQIGVLLDEAEREFAVITEIFKGVTTLEAHPYNMPYITIPTGTIRLRRAKLDSGTRPLDLINFNELDTTLYNESDYQNELVSDWETVEGEPRLMVMDETEGKGRLVPRITDTDTVEETLTNPNFDTNITGWTDGTTGTSTATVVSGELVLNLGGGGDSCFIDQSITSVVGDRYNIVIDKTLNNSKISIGTTQGASDAYAGADDAIDVNFFFAATTTTLWVRLENPTIPSKNANITEASLLHTVTEHPHPIMTIHYIRYPTTAITSASINTELTDTRHQLSLITYARARAYGDQDADTYDPAQAELYMSIFNRRATEFRQEIDRRTRRAGAVRYGGY